MTVYRPTDAETFEVHGSRFVSFVRGDRGSSSLCAWRLEVPPGLAGVAHRPSHEEVLLLLEGTLSVTLDGVVTDVAAGDVVRVPAGSELKVDSGPDGATAWVTTTRGLEAAIGDQVMRPPWAQ
jgi:quercetin dioxygenase-like cupin family protein